MYNERERVWSSEHRRDLSADDVEVFSGAAEPWPLRPKAI